MCSNHESSDTATATGFASSITILDTVVTQMRLHPVKEARWFLWENALNFNFVGYCKNSGAFYMEGSRKSRP